MENKNKLTLKEIVLFGLIGAIMYVSKLAMSFIPNVHLLGVFIIVCTLVWRKKALFPLYTYVLLDGIFAGFALWWLPYLYVWTILWAAAMLLPKDTIEKKRRIPCMLICGAHGLLFGTLTAPAYALMYGMNFKATIDWIIAGLPYDAIHGASNLVLGLLIIPLASALKKVITTHQQN